MKHLVLVANSTKERIEKRSRAYHVAVLSVMFVAYCATGCEQNSYDVYVEVLRQYDTHMEMAENLSVPEKYSGSRQGRAAYVFREVHAGLRKDLQSLVESRNASTDMKTVLLELLNAYSQLEQAHQATLDDLASSKNGAADAANEPRIGQMMRKKTIILDNMKQDQQPKNILRVLQREGLRATENDNQ